MSSRELSKKNGEKNRKGSFFRVFPKKSQVSCFRWRTFTTLYDEVKQDAFFCRVLDPDQIECMIWEYNNFVCPKKSQNMKFYGFFGLPKEHFLAKPDELFPHCMTKFLIISFWTIMWRSLVTANSVKVVHSLEGNSVRGLQVPVGAMIYNILLHQLPSF